MNNKYEWLRLENQLCFPLYAASKEVVKKYTPFLNELNLTYTQYITMMVIWENEEVSVKDLCIALFLDTGTLSPVLKALESKDFITRRRSAEDERILMVSLTDNGRELREKALEIPQKIGSCINISADDAKKLYRILYKILGKE